MANVNIYRDRYITTTDLVSAFARMRFSRFIGESGYTDAPYVKVDGKSQILPGLAIDFCYADGRAPCQHNAHRETIHDAVKTASTIYANIYHGCHYEGTAEWNYVGNGMWRRVS